MSEFERDVVEVDDEGLATISSLCGTLAEKRVEEAELKSRLRVVTDEIAKIEEVDLPGAFDQAGVAEVTLPTGQKISISDTLYASIPKKNLSEAVAWLVANQHGSLVKQDVVAHFDRGDQAEALRLMSSLREMGIENVTSVPNVNTGSVKKMIRELTEEGRDVPLKLFGAYWRRHAVIK